MLEEVELLVAGGGPEVGALHRQRLPLRLALAVDEGEGRLAAEGRVGQHQVVVDPRMGPQAVVHGDVGLVAADAVEVQVHGAEARRAVHNLPAVQGVALQPLPLVPVHGRVMVTDVVVGRQQEAAGAAGRVADGVVGAGAHHVHDGPDQRARREVLPGAGLHVLGVALQQRLVGVALHVGAELQPVLAVDELPHQPGQHGRFLDSVLGLAEDDAQGAGLLAQRLQGAAVVGLQLGAVEGQQVGPAAALGDGRRPVVRQQGVGRAAALVHHLEEDEVGELLQVVAVGQPGVAQDVAVVPELLPDAGRAVVMGGPLLFTYLR